jgi:hypothetical protein
MKTITLCLTALSALALASCGSEPAEEAAPVEVAPAAPVATLPAPDEARFAQVFAASCEGAEPVSTSVCKRAMGATEAICNFGLGEDEALRHKATLTANEVSTDWVLADPENICTEHGAHHVDL